MTIALHQRPAFKRVYKKPHINQRAAVHDAMRELIANPMLGEEKMGDPLPVFGYTNSTASTSNIYSPTYGMRRREPGLQSAPSKTFTATSSANPASTAQLQIKEARLI